MKRFFGFIRTISFLYVLSACTDFTDQYHYYVDPELALHVDSFYAEAHTNGLELPKDDLSVRLTHHADNTWGDCYTGSRIITLDRNFVHDFQNFRTHYDSLKVEYVVFHELGHGLLMRDHCGGKSIMNANDEHLLIYASESNGRQRMIHELFAGYLQ